MGRVTVQIPDALLAELSFDPYVLRAWEGAAAPNGFLMRGAGWPRVPHAAGLRVQYATPAGAVLRLCAMAADPLDEQSGATALAAARDLAELTFAGDPENGIVLDEPAPGLTALVWRHVHERARDWRGWPQLTWTVQGRPVPAATWDFSGGSCAFAVVGGVGIACASYGVPLDGLDLVAVPRRSTAPSGVEVLLLDEASRRAAPRFPRPNLDAWHADHLALLSRSA